MEEAASIIIHLDCYDAIKCWKSRACLTPEGKAVLTPENLFVLTPVKS